MWIYKITNEINNKIYIGQTIVSVEERWYKHKWNALNLQKYALHQAMHKYGIENFKIEILTETNSKEDLDRLEKKYIKEYNSFVNQNGYNMTDGGEGSSPTEEVKQKLREARKDYKHSPETIEKLKKAWEKRGPVSEEARQNMSKAAKGKPKGPFSEEHKRKLTEARRKRGSYSEKTRRKMSESMKGKNKIQKKVKCPHCPKSGGQSNMSRYHFDNCKLKRKLKEETSVQLAI